MKTTPSPTLTTAAVECLEARIAPASFLTFTDVDGDTVTIKSSKGDITGKATFSNAGSGQHLDALDLTDPSFAGTSVVFKVQRGPSGDGFVNVGTIDASGNDVKRIFVKGDLSEIDAGDSDLATPAVKKLIARSIGLFAPDGSPNNDPLDPNQNGALIDILGPNGVGGILVTILTTVENLLSQDGISADVQRLLGSLSSDIESILSSTTGLLGSLTLTGLPTTLVQLLQNLSNDVGDLLGLTPLELDQLGNLEGLLLDLDLDLGTLLDVDVEVNGLLPGIDLGIDLGDLLGLDLDDLPDILVDVLEGVQTTLQDLLTTPGLDLSVLPQTVRDLLGSVSERLTGVLGETEDLTIELLRDVSQLQSILTSVLGIANNTVGYLTETVSILLQDVLEAITGLVTVLPGGPNDPSGSPAVSSDFLGDVRLIKVRGDVSDVLLNIQGDLGRAKIGGNLTGGEDDNSGEIFVSGDVKKIRIKGNVVGGDAIGSGSIQVEGITNRVFVGGSVLGGEGTRAGALTFGGDVTGIRIGRDLVGDLGAFSGTINSVNGGIDIVNLGGSIIGAPLEGSAAISVNEDIQSLRVGGSILGDANHAVNITAAGLNTQDGVANQAFGNIFVKGAVNHANILGGFNADLAGVNGSAQIQKVVVLGNWNASSLSAGVADVDGDGFGDADDAVISTRDSGLLSKIASIRVRGVISGTGGGSDHYGFVASEISKFVSGKVALQLSGTAPDTVPLSQTTGDVQIREVPPTNPT